MTGQFTESQPLSSLNLSVMPSNLQEHVPMLFTNWLAMGRLALDYEMLAATILGTL